MVPTTQRSARPAGRPSVQSSIASYASSASCRRAIYADWKKVSTPEVMEKFLAEIGEPIICLELTREL